MEMALRFEFVFATHYILALSLTIYDEVTNNTEFYYKELSIYPSKIATMDYYELR